MSTDNSSELVSCPFCRCRTVLRSSDLPMVDDGSVHCDGCRASAPSDDAWNTRASTDQSSTDNHFVDANKMVPEGFALVPIEPTEAMHDAGRSAVMARDCSGSKWSPRQHYKASGISTDGIPDSLLEGYHSIIPKGQGAALVYAAMIAARPQRKEGV